MKELCLILSGVLIGFGAVCWLLILSHRASVEILNTNPKDK